MCTGTEGDFGMIKVEGLTKTYGTVKAIQDIGFHVKKGEVVGFLGPNGAGKSTTMKIITGYMAPTQGKVEVAGFDAFENPIEVKRRIGFLPETPPLYTDMLVIDYLDYVAKLKGVPSSQRKANVQSAIDAANLGDVAHRLIQNLSKGYKQRVGIAQALVSDPEILILDEPTVGLDPKQVAEVRDLIKKLRGKHTIILSTHILPEVQMVCDRVIIINKGRIVAEDTLSDLNNKMTGGRKLHVRVKTPSAELLQKLNRVEGVQSILEKTSGVYEISTINSDSPQENVAALVATSGAGLIEIKSQELNLEDIFLKLVSEEARP
jgi:ABC-2 type transport system ATP-binding protein